MVDKQQQALWDLLGVKPWQRRQGPIAEARSLMPLSSQLVSLTQTASRADAKSSLSVRPVSRVTRESLQKKEKLLQRSESEHWVSGFDLKCSTSSANKQECTAQPPRAVFFSLLFAVISDSMMLLSDHQEQDTEQEQLFDNIQKAARSLMRKPVAERVVERFYWPLRPTMPIANTRENAQETLQGLLARHVKPGAHIVLLGPHASEYITGCFGQYNSLLETASVASAFNYVYACFEHLQCLAKDRDNKRRLWAYLKKHI